VWHPFSVPCGRGVPLFDINLITLTWKGFFAMKYIRSEKYSTRAINDLLMGPNPVKLTEELLLDHQIPNGATVMDLGCGRGVTSVFLAKEYGFRVFATDLWISATENRQFFDRM